MTKYISISALLLAFSSQIAASTDVTETDSLHYNLELMSSTSAGDHTPLWLHSNKHGLGSLKKANGYFRAAVIQPLCGKGDWKFGYGADVAATTGFTSHTVVQQLYGEVKWKDIQLTAGSKEYEMELKDQLLSTGSQTFGINARPIPQVRAGLPDYWYVPGTGKWIAVKGHIAYGIETDNGWQRDFTLRKSRYTEDILFHGKAAYIRVGKGPEARTSFEVGMELGTQFGGTTCYPDGTTIKNKGGLKGMLRVLIPGGSDTGETIYTNALGNSVGSWVARFNHDSDAWGFSLYADHFFEDHSSLTHLGPDGYGEGDQWDVKVKKRFIFYDIKDMLWGLELRLPRQNWFNKVVVEYLYSKYQCGPIYHDHDQTITDQIAGRDNFYNHGNYPGWIHWGEVMGNPLYLSPIYNDDHVINVKNNRMAAWHLGISGHPLPQLHYRLLATWQEGLGTYSEPFPDPRHNVSVLAEATYHFGQRPSQGGWSIRAAAGADKGSLLGDNYGFQLSIIKSGIIKSKKK